MLLFINGKQINNIIKLDIEGLHSQLVTILEAFQQYPLLNIASTEFCGYGRFSLTRLDDKGDTITEQYISTKYTFQKIRGYETDKSRVIHYCNDSKLLATREEDDTKSQI